MAMLFGLANHLLDVMMLLVVLVVMVMRNRMRRFLGSSNAADKQAGADHQRGEDFLHGDVPESVRMIAAENAPRDYDSGAIWAFA